jgi:hypothetical protein
MKNLVYALVGAGFMIACQPSDQPEISGMLTGIESDTLLVQSFPVNDRDSRRTDTIAMQNGSFAFNLGDSVLKQVYIYGKPSVKPNEDGSIPAISMKAVNFLLLPGQPIKISGSLDEYKLEGGSFYDDYKYAIIGTPSKEYLWILSRDKTISDEVLNKLLEKISNMGFDKSKLIYTIQE